MAPLNGFIFQSRLVPKAFYENGFPIVLPSSTPPLSNPPKNPHLLSAKPKSPKGSIDPAMP
jgi:hypothetical protein